MPPFSAHQFIKLWSPVAEELQIDFLKMTMPRFFEAVKIERLKQKREFLPFIGLAFFISSVLGVTIKGERIKNKEQLAPYFLTSLPEDPNAEKLLLKEADQLLKMHEARHAKRRRSASR